VKAICALYINIFLLRKVNLDLQAARFVEILACGAFILVENTEEHIGLFNDNKEAEFFSFNEDLFIKVEYYIINPEIRIQIAAAGRERCIRAGYSNHER